jgi:hypothetical protein
MGGEWEKNGNNIAVGFFSGNDILVDTNKLRAEYKMSGH